MRINHISKTVIERYGFQVNYKGLALDVVIYLGENGRFADEEITLNGEELEYEGTEGEIREAVTDYLAENWEELTK